jgi:hypothetical protein
MVPGEHGAGGMFHPSPAFQIPLFPSGVQVILP